MNMSKESIDSRVKYGKPDWSSIREEGLLSVDMHYHTCYSDSFTQISSAIRLAERRKVGFAVTDHNLIRGAARALEYKSDVTIIPGIEISSWDGPHILVYFYDMDTMQEYWTDNVKPYIENSPWLAITKDTEWILNSLEGVNCLVSAAHPMGYAGFNKGVQKCIDKGYLDSTITSRLDAYEVICSGMTRVANERALKCAKKAGLGYTGGTDGHLMHEVGNVVSISDAKDVDGFLDDVKKGRNTIVGTEKSPPMKVAMGLSTVVKFMPYVSPSLAIHFRQNLGKNSVYRRQIRRNP